MRLPQRSARERRLGEEKGGGGEGKNTVGTISSCGAWIPFDGWLVSGTASPPRLKAGLTRFVVDEVWWLSIMGRGGAACPCTGGPSPAVLLLIRGSSGPYNSCSAPWPP